jgi:hypothetical protein
MTDKKEPKNELEYLIAGARRDLVSAATLWIALQRSHVYVLCDREWDGKSVDGPLNTLLMKPEDGSADLLAVFTDPERAAYALQKYPDYKVVNKVPGMLALFQVGGDRGLALNVGEAFELSIAPVGIDQLKQAYGPRPVGSQGAA